MEWVSQGHAQRLKKLHLSKYRYAQKAFLVEGDKIIQEIIQSESAYLKAIYIEEGYTPTYPLPTNIPIYLLSQKQGKTLTQMQVFPKIMAMMSMPQILPYNPNQNALFLESIRDPGNLGTILRVCDWYGIPQVLMTPDCADVYNPKTLQASMGSFIRVACIPVEDIPSKHGYIYTAHLQGIPIEQVQFKHPFILHIGNESRGIQRKIKESICITIPRMGKAESLNVAIAAAICLDRIRTQS
ncbi:MAG: RNA methyltransferase [Bacteroidia bacterium]|nr:RNA methyltransferase [Bacteroidia bacterium]MDW8345741.1 RNA methyltransferase [Bacteroidia bacterium]